MDSKNVLLFISDDWLRLQILMIWWLSYPISHTNKQPHLHLNKFNFRQSVRHEMRWLRCCYYIPIFSAENTCADFLWFSKYYGKESYRLHEYSNMLLRKQKVPSKMKLGIGVFAIVISLPRIVTPYPCQKFVSICSDQWLDRLWFFDVCRVVPSDLRFTWSLPSTFIIPIIAETDCFSYNASLYL